MGLVDDSVRRSSAPTPNRSGSRNAIDFVSRQGGTVKVPYAKKWQKEAGKLRKIVLDCDMIEEIKWGNQPLGLRPNVLWRCNALTELRLAPRAGLEAAACRLTATKVI
jgi:hypothetical protein